MLVSISDAKAKLNQLVTSSEATVITKNGDPKAAIIPYETYKRMLRNQREIEDIESIKRAEEFFAGDRKAVSQKELDKIMDGK